MTMFIKYQRTNVFNKISIGANDLLQAASELVAGMGNLLPGQVLFDQGLLCVGGFINILISVAPDIIVKGVEVWATRRPNLLVNGCFWWLRSFFVTILSPQT